MLLRVAAQEGLGDPGFFRRGRFRLPRRIRGLTSAIGGLLPGPLGLATTLMGDPRKKIKHAALKGKAQHKLAKLGKHGAKKRALHLDLGKLGEAALGAIPVVGGVAQELAGQLAPQISGGGSAAEEAVAALPQLAGLHPAHAAKVGRALGLGHRRRTMRVTNVHALRRSMRRVTGFAKLARKVMTFTTHHRIKRHRRK